MTDDLDLCDEHELSADTLNGVTQQLIRAIGQKRKAGFGGKDGHLVTTVKLQCPPAQRDEGLRAIQTLRRHLPRPRWAVMVGSDADDGRFHVVLTETHQAKPLVTPSWVRRVLPPWLLRLLSKFLGPLDDAPAVEPSPDDEQVREATSRAVRRARQAAPPSPGERLVGATVTFLYASWRPALQRFQQANRRRGLDVTLNYAEGSLTPDLLEALSQDDGIRVELHYGPAADAAPRPAPPATLPPDAMNGSSATLPPDMGLEVELQRGARKARGLLTPDGNGDITLGRCGGQASQMQQLLRQVDAELRLSAQLRNAARLRLQEGGLLVSAEGHPDYFRLENGQPLRLGTRLELPARVIANGVQVDFRIVH